MPSGFHHPTLVYNQDLISVANGGQPVSNNNGCPAPQYALESVLDEQFSLSINVSRGLV
jgi:hypothetical protein